MRDKKMFVSVILFTTVMLFAGGCGRQAEPVSAASMETENPIEDEAAVDDKAVEDEIVVDDKDADTEEDSKVSEVDSTNESKSNDSQNGDSQNGSSSQNNGSQSNSSNNSQGNSQNNSSQSNESQSDGSQSSDSQNTPQAPATAPEVPAATPEPAPTPEPTPVHEHTWKEHTATRQVWVSNWVTVEDYGVDRVCVGRQYTCDCGWSTMDRNAMHDHGYNHAVNGDPYGGFVFGDVYEEQVVCIGSHQEDQGYYADETYVDYHYCDCGATN